MNRALEDASLDPVWFDDYAAGCSQAAHLYATALHRLSLEMGEQNALALAPVVLRDVIALGQEHAMRLEAERFQAANAVAVQDAETRYLAALELRSQQAQDPW
ncbi:MAG: hypothetical protein LW834_17530 [Cyanobium sp. 49614_E6]|jgi:hypothetical protein|nr:hypothetical protein [Cyanobium sp. 49614_E6]MCE2838726.1 hypothetical protein [Cyanobium sp. 49614_E6]